MTETGKATFQRPSKKILTAYGLLCLFFAICAWMLARYSGVVFPVYLSLGFGVVLFMLQFKRCFDTRGAVFYIASAGYYFVAGLLLYLNGSDMDSDRAGLLIGITAVLAWVAFWLTLYRRWPFSYFRLVLILTTCLWGFDIYLAIVFRPMPLSLIAENPQTNPRVVFWSPNGDEFYINRDNELEGKGSLERYNIPEGTHHSIPFTGIISQAALSPDGGTLAVIYEESKKSRHLSLMDPKGYFRQKIHSVPRSIYFPFRSTQSPWSEDGRFALFMDIEKEQAALWTYDRRHDRTRLLAEGIGISRTFWMDHSHIAIPRGATSEPTQIMNVEKLKILSATDALAFEMRPLDRSYRTLYAYDNRAVLLKSQEGQGFWAESDLRNAVEIPTKQISYLEVDFSPDGQWMAYAENRNGGVGGTQLKVFHRKSGTLKTLFRSPIGRINSLAWSPGGQWIAFSLLTENGWLSSGASLLVVSPQSARYYKVGKQNPEMVKFYEKMGRKFLFWRPGWEHLLFWNIQEHEEGMQKAAYTIVHCS